MGTLLPQYIGNTCSAIFPIREVDFPKLLSSVCQQCGWDRPSIHYPIQTLNATRQMQFRYVGGNRKSLLVLRWRRLQGRQTWVEWTVFDNTTPHQKFFDAAAMTELGKALEAAAQSWVATEVTRPRIPLDPIVGPRERVPERYSGEMKDYSGCASEAELTDLFHGALPIGTYAFERPPGNVWHGRKLFLSQFKSDGAPMEEHGVLLCAPQGTGKTSLLLRWAVAAIENGYSTFIVDVKGNMLNNLKRRLAAKGLNPIIYYFSTDPDVVNCDRINVLSGIRVDEEKSEDQIRQIARGLLPGESYKGKGEEEFRYTLQFSWLAAMIQFLKLAEYYYPESFKDEFDQPRGADLSDLYKMAAREELISGWTPLIRQREAEYQESERPLPNLRIDEIIETLKGLLGKAKMVEGEREKGRFYREYTEPMVLALEPYREGSSLHKKIRDAPPVALLAPMVGQDTNGSLGTLALPDRHAGRLFRFEYLGQKGRPVVMVLAVRETEKEKAEAILSMSFARLSDHINKRQHTDRSELGRLLLLLDEAPRIHTFDIVNYATVRRECKVGWVAVYQATDLIIKNVVKENIEEGKDAIKTVLQNVGTQIYLGSLVDSTYTSFINLLPKRDRWILTRTETRTQDGLTVTETRSMQPREYFTTAELYRLPAGRYPALIYINDQPKRDPFLVDMDEALLKQ